MTDAGFVTARFEIRRRLGAGGMGVVYEALDRSRGGVVALKTLADLDPQSLLRFKNEFRSLADIAHPNLVPLYELFAEENIWYFTMEYVEGQTFLNAIAGRGSTDAAESSDQDETRTVLEPDSLSGSFFAPALARSFDFDRLRDALRQVVEGLAALHENGKLHRDIKPSNILISPAGRVVILDFGLVSELREMGKPGTIAGTYAYMSPEQVAKRPLTPASDWYALGTMLFQALTGEMPFSGSTAEVLIAKTSREADSVTSRGAAVPEDLADLCDRLLRRDPEARPDLAEILRRLAGVRAGHKRSVRAALDAIRGPGKRTRDARCGVSRCQVGPGFRGAVARSVGSGQERADPALSGPPRCARSDPLAGPLLRTRVGAVQSGR
jgi:serine/threonine protein kinase